MTKREISRRTFMIGAGGLVAAGAIAWAAKGALTTSPSASTTVRNPLNIPPVLDGTEFDLELAPSTLQLLEGAATPTYGYNGESFWGPTLRWKKGDEVTLNVTNNLPEMTTTHWHGVHVPQDTDGGPHQMIEVGETWSPGPFKVKNEAATYWYHPHMHGTTQMQVTMGAGGFIIIDDDSPASNALPAEYGIDDIPLVLTSRRFDDANAFKTDRQTAYGDVMLANGVIDAEFTAPAQLVRFRILNGEVERFFNLGFTGDRTFYVVATDGGLVDAPIPVTRIRMVPGERYEIVVDLTNEPIGSSLDMMAFNSGQVNGFGGGEPLSDGEFGSLLNNIDFPLLRINVGEPTTSARTSLPSVLATNALWKATDATNSRALTIDHGEHGSDFTFDGHSYDMSVIDQTVQLGAIESWAITSNHIFGHAFHIHDVQFAIVSRSSGEVADYERGWKDTLGIMPNETVTFIAKFEDYADPTLPYMYHCHMLNHEDGGLMGQFLVVA